MFVARWLRREDSRDATPRAGLLATRRDCHARAHAHARVPPRARAGGPGPLRVGELDQHRPGTRAELRQAPEGTFGPDSVGAALRLRERDALRALRVRGGPDLAHHRRPQGEAAHGAAAAAESGGRGAGEPHVRLRGVLPGGGAGGVSAPGKGEEKGAEDEGKDEEKGMAKERKVIFKKI